jgi:hypothetical protein
MTRTTGITARLLARRSIPHVAELEAHLLQDGKDEVILLQTVAERGDPRVQRLALPARDALGLQALAAVTLERLADPDRRLAGIAGGVELAREPLSDGDELRSVWLDGEGSPYFALVVGGPEQGRLIIVDGRYGAELVRLLSKGAAAVAPRSRATVH